MTHEEFNGYESKSQMKRVEILKEGVSMTDICGDCYGSGFIVIKTKPVKCPACNGKGEV